MVSRSQHPTTSPLVKLDFSVTRARLLPSSRSSPLSQIPTHRLSSDLILRPPLPQLLPPPDLPLQPEFRLQPPLIQSKRSSLSNFIQAGTPSNTPIKVNFTPTAPADIPPTLWTSSSPTLNLNSSPPLPKSSPLS